MKQGTWRGWIIGGIVLLGLAALVRHLGEFGKFVTLARQAQPLWLAVALLFQLGTYASVASGWRAVLRRAGADARLWPLMRIAVSKLFLDQALPTAGMSGNVLLVDQLILIGVPRGIAVAALLISMIGFYAIYVVFALTALFLLWLGGKATPFLAGVVTSFTLVAIAIPALALWLRHRGRRPLPAWLGAIGPIRRLLETVALAPSGLLRDRRLVARVTLCNALIFLLDAATLYACLHALGQTAGFATALIASIMASLAVTLAPLPFGLGSFEIACTAALHLLGVSFEAALTSTMLLRMLMLWLPLLPGMLLIRRTTAARP